MDIYLAGLAYGRNYNNFDRYSKVRDVLESKGHKIVNVVPSQLDALFLELSPIHVINKNLKAMALADVVVDIGTFMDEEAGIYANSVADTVLAPSSTRKDVSYSAVYEMLLANERGIKTGPVEYFTPYIEALGLELYYVENDDSYFALTKFNVPVLVYEKETTRFVTILDANAKQLTSSEWMKDKATFELPQNQAYINNLDGFDSDVFHIVVGQ